MATQFFLLMVLVWGSADASATKPIDAQEWKKLSRTAKTPDEFRKLELYCLRQAEFHDNKAVEAERELERVKADPMGLGRLPKWPKREETLKDLVGVYRGQAKEWRERAAQYQQRLSGAN